MLVVTLLVMGIATFLIGLLDRFDSALPVALYVLGGLLITIVSVWLAPETARISLHDEPASDRRIVQDPRRLRPT